MEERKLKVGDDVRVIQKQDNKTKGYFPKWSKEVYKVTFIKDNDYMINKHKIKHMMVVDGAHAIERINRTLKEKYKQD